MTEVDAWVEMKGEDSEVIEVIVDLGVEIGPTLWIKVRREGIITAENQGIL